MKHFTPERMDAYISKHSQTFQSHFSAHDLPCHAAAFHALYEHMLKFVMPLCTQLVHPKAKTPVSASTHIIDITGVGFGQFWKIKKYLQRAIVAATTHYPDTLGHIFVSLIYQRVRSRSSNPLTWFCPGRSSALRLLLSKSGK